MEGRIELFFLESYKDLVIENNSIDFHVLLCYDVSMQGLDKALVDVDKVRLRIVRLKEMKRLGPATADDLLLFVMSLREKITNANRMVYMKDSEND